MVRFAKLTAAALALGAGLVLAGCQSASHHSSNITCDHCKVANVRTPYTVPGYEGPRAAGYLTTRDLECATCRTASATLTQTGKLDAKCPTCGGNRKIAMAN